jgi:hypothetical protein
LFEGDAGAGRVVGVGREPGERAYRLSFKTGNGKNKGEIQGSFTPFRMTT